MSDFIHTTIVNFDPLGALLVVVFGALCVWTGVLACSALHEHRGIKRDRPWTDLLPWTPDPIVVPDHVPDWLDERTP